MGELAALEDREASRSEHGTVGQVEEVDDSELLQQPSEFVAFSMSVITHVTGKVLLLGEDGLVTRQLALEGSEVSSDGLLVRDTTAHAGGEHC